MILACLFSTLDNVVTLSNAHGTIAVQTAAPLFWRQAALPPVLSFDLAERRYMGLVMLGIAVLSTISIRPWRPAPIPTWALSSFI